MTLGVAWFIYLITGNTPGQKSYYSYYFDKRYAARGPALAVSFGTVAAVLAVARFFAHQHGYLIVWQMYGFPLLVFASWLVVVTFLHHNDETVPWFAADKWTFVSGNLSSVDRSYGDLVNNVSHSIHLHQIHHLFPSSVPHYHLKEATDAFRKAYPNLVRKSEKPWPLAFWDALVDWITLGGAANAKPNAEGVFRYIDNKKSKKTN